MCGQPHSQRRTLVHRAHVCTSPKVKSRQSSGCISDSKGALFLVHTGGSGLNTEVREARPRGSGALSAPAYGSPERLCPRPHPHSAERRQPGKDSCLSSDVSVMGAHGESGVGRGPLLCRAQGRSVRCRSRRAWKLRTQCGSRGAAARPHGRER